MLSSLAVALIYPGCAPRPVGPHSSLPGHYLAMVTPGIVCWQVSYARGYSQGLAHIKHVSYHSNYFSGPKARVFNLDILSVE